jgi:quercetin dioxygenase-like cupin family protein
MATPLSHPDSFGERFSLERPLDGPHLTFDLAAEADRLRREGPWKAGGHNAITLAKYPDLRLVLAVLRAGAHTAPHGPEERLAIQLLSGRLRVQTGGHAVDLAAGQLLTLDRTRAHDIQALEDAAFLLTVAHAAR